MESPKALGFEQILDVELQVGHARNDFFNDPLSDANPASNPNFRSSWLRAQDQ